MADRHAPIGSRVPATGAGFNRASTAPTVSTGMTGSNVRRNLFQSQLTRRPTAPSTVTQLQVGGAPGGMASSTADTLRLGSLDAPDGAAGSASSSSVVATDSSSDIVIRDKNGEIELLDDPPTPLFDDNDVDGERGHAMDHARMESEERQRLAEAVKQHQIDQNSLPSRPEELLEAVRASLRAKVAALADDNWMYEREDPPRCQ